MLNVALDSLKLFPSSPSIQSKSNNQNKLIWTADLCNISELIYALFHSKCINGGEATIKQITEGFERLLNINIKNISHNYLRIRGRVGERAAFISKLYDNLNNAMTESDK